MLRYLPLTALIAIAAPALAQETAEMDTPTFEEVDGNEDGLVSLGEAIVMIDGVDVAEFVSHDTDASAFLSEREFKAWRLGLTTELTLEDNA